MRPYGREFEHPLTRIRPDVGDALELGLPSRIAKIKSKNRRSARRELKKKFRRFSKKMCQNEYSY